MTPQQLLAHADSGQLWPETAGAAPTFGDLRGAYRTALAVRALRVARGEVPSGFKIGFTNRGIWERYRVFAPIWGTVYDTTVSFDLGAAPPLCVSVSGWCQPRIEPEVVFGLAATPPQNAGLQGLFESIDWVAPGFEVVQSHCAGWRFTADQTVADGGLHARLVVGSRTPVRAFARDAAELQAALANARVGLHRDGVRVESGRGANVLGDPLQALRHFLVELRDCAGAPDLNPGDVVTTGTWTDAWPVQAGQTWRADFSAPLTPLSLSFV